MNPDKGAKAENRLKAEDLSCSVLKKPNFSFIHRFLMLECLLKYSFGRKNKRAIE
jgi:hypothetical protein